MGSPRAACHPSDMRLWWNHLWKSHAYRRGTVAERREIELRFCVARALKAKRRALHITQNQLAERLGVAQSTISRVERASNRVTLDIALRGFFALGFTDEEISAVFNAGANRGVQILRQRAAERLFPRARPEGTPRPVIADRDHRFVRKGVSLRGSF